jgi:hypothetical protein
MQSSCKWTFYSCSSFSSCSPSPSSFLLLFFFRLFALCLKAPKRFFHSTLSPLSCSVVCDAFDPGELGTQQQHNTTQPKQDPRLCLSVLSTRNEIEEPATDTREGKKKKRNKNKNKNKTKKIKHTTNTKKQLQRSNALSFFLSRPPPPTPR